VTLKSCYFNLAKHYSS